MKFKPVPEPPVRSPAPDADGDGSAAELLAAAQRAVPLVPGSETDCCERLRSRLGLADRGTARTWLTFLRALGLARETERGFVRTERAATPEAVREAFRERVFGAADLLALLDAEGPLTADAAFERFADRVPTWEREKHPDWRGEWRERVERILAWAVLLGLAERVEGGYDA